MVDENNDTTAFSPELLLNKSTFKEFLKNEKGELKIFISGATANSFAFEPIYLGNPGAYQTFIVGVNDICPSFEELENPESNLASTPAPEVVEKIETKQPEKPPEKTDKVREIPEDVLRKILE